MRASSCAARTQFNAAGRSVYAARASRAAPARSAVAVVAETATVSDTKAAFMEAYPYPLPGMWAPVVGELLVQHHLYKFHPYYKYNKVAALGLVSVLDQVLEGYPAEGGKDEVMSAFFKSVGEDVAEYRADAEALVSAAEAAGSLEKLLEEPTFAAMGEESKPYYTKWLAVGLFRCLELVGATDPKALEQLVAAAAVPQSKVNSDLGMYKGTLSKMQAARELMAEVLEREKRKTAERLAAKEAKAAASTEEEANVAPSGDTSAA
mmetsp:Transcript_5029/g.17447  ORF Transcript_5029/g.17447 Transcript_5029/m.17447 type:complete len:264 (-) Transcript_5029:212-1003(-)|eukprot:CAMPEP_0170163832 /NCGR_PEP_ID=MMETSP0033_2-20121228/77800_1 /TAXON_ID=195969 /ORGANISM="Dolichomastix tenuilepis, Strain CCMP3274" /LENGTH=263 /DNA_ID=CAMNT_0010401469 /DNA_START=37 /DNA_END=828 /DNA_ORIENTATION=+